MCCLFGLVDYEHRLRGRQKTRIIQALALESEVRGTDTAGIAYNTGRKLRVYKRPGPAHKLSLFLPKDTYVVMGYTRLTTQGSEKKNYNSQDNACLKKVVRKEYRWLQALLDYSYTFTHRALIFGDFVLLS